MTLRFLIIGMLTICAATLGSIRAPAAAQSIPIPQADLQEIVKTHPGGWLIVSGDQVLINDINTGSPINLGRLSRLPLLFATFRLLDKRVINIDDLAARWAPDLDLDVPFTVPITVRRLLAETAGFKTPDWLSVDGWAKLSGANLSSHMDTDPYIKMLRTAGMMTHKDAIGSYVLIQVLEGATGKDFLTILRDEVSEPLGLPADSFTTDSRVNAPPFLQTSIALHALPEALIKLLNLLNMNKESTGADFVTVRAVTSMKTSLSWQLHPLGPGHTLGFHHDYIKDRPVLEMKAWPCLKGSDIASVGLAWLPQADLILVSLGQGDACNPAGAKTLAAELGIRFVPPIDRSLVRLEAAALPLSQFLGGYYLPDDAPTDWLSLRLDRIYTSALKYVPTEGGAQLMQNNQIIDEFIEVSPLNYVGKTGDRMVVGPRYQGGHLVWKDRYYRYAGPMGDMVLVLSPFFWMIGIVLSGGIYAVVAKNAKWRRMGIFCIAGPIMMVSGIAAEINWWPTVWIADGGYWQVIAWRMIMNIGLMMIIGVAMFAVTISRAGLLPSGPRYGLASAHLVLLALASTVLLLLSIAWGIAGTLSPLST